MRAPYQVMQVCKPYHYAMVEAVEPFKLHPTFMAYKYEVFEHHQLLGMALKTPKHISFQFIHSVDKI